MRDERCILSRTKQTSCTMVQRQEEGVDYDEVLQPVARMKQFRLFLACASFMGLHYLSDGCSSSAMLYMATSQRCYFMAPPASSPRAWYEGLSNFSFETWDIGEGAIDKTLFIMKDTKRYHVYKVTIKPASTPIEAHKSLGKDEEGEDVDVHLYRFQSLPKDSPFHLEAFSDSDYAGDNHDRRSTSGGCQYLGRRLVSWQCKKQTIVAISSTEAEYVAAASCCAQDLSQNQKFNFSLMILTGMLGHISNGTPFLMYPRFVQLFLNKQLEGVDRPQDFIPSVSLPSKVFTFMRKHSPKFSCRITPLTPSMLEVVTALAAEEEHSTSPHSRAASSARDAQGTPTQSAAHSQRTASVQVQGTDTLQGTAAYQGTASIPKSPNDYTPTDASQTSGGDEETTISRRIYSTSFFDDIVDKDAAVLLIWKEKSDEILRSLQAPLSLFSTPVLFKLWSLKNNFKAAEVPCAVSRPRGLSIHWSHLNSNLQPTQKREQKILRKRKATIAEEQPSKKPKLRTETIDELRNYLRVVDFEYEYIDREDLLSTYIELLKTIMSTCLQRLRLMLLGVHTLEIEDGTMFHMLAERRLSSIRELMLRMLDHGMEVR
ncbi:hypothetical protein Tco_0523800 [Tanacetum coccineum]